MYAHVCVDKNTCTAGITNTFLTEACDDMSALEKIICGKRWHILICIETDIITSHALLCPFLFVVFWIQFLNSLLDINSILALGQSKCRMRNGGNKMSPSDRNNCNHHRRTIWWWRSTSLQWWRPDLKPQSGVEMKGSFDCSPPLLPTTVCSMKSWIVGATNK